MFDHAIRAYFHWESEGRPDGRDLEHWLITEIGSIAARAIARHDALIHHPIDEKSASREARRQLLRDQYVEDHWLDFHPGVVDGLRAFEQRQIRFRFNPAR